MLRCHIMHKYIYVIHTVKNSVEVYVIYICFSLHLRQKAYTTWCIDIITLWNVDIKQNAVYGIGNLYMHYTSQGNIQK